MAVIRKKLRKAAEVGGMSFLDVMTCGFGAVVLLLILANEDVFTDSREFAQDLIRNPLAEEETRIAEELRTASDRLKALTSRLQETKKERYLSQEELSALTENNRSVRNSSARSQKASYVAGLPTGSEYLVFIIDTSGSMKRFWGRVKDRVVQIMNLHPQVKGLQILDDNGNPLLPSYKRAWIPDTKVARNRAIKALEEMSGFSNSSPAEGLEIALRSFTRPETGVSIYVLGDDFTGPSYDTVLNTVERWNIDSDGSTKATIHALGFPWGLGDRYATLTRELADRTNGVFVGLPY